MFGRAQNKKHPKHNVLIAMKIRKICQDYHFRNKLFEGLQAHKVVITAHKGQNIQLPIFLEHP